MKTQQLNVGDLVAFFIRDRKDNYIVGMITRFTPAYTSYTIEWFNGLPTSNCTWATTQGYRNNYLDYRTKLK